MGFFNGLSKFFKNTKKSISKAFDNLGKGISKGFKSVTAGIGSAGHTLGTGIKTVYTDAKGAIGTVYHDGIGIVKSTGSFVSSTVGKEIDLGKTLINKGGDTISSLGSSLSMPLLLVGGAALLFMIKK